MVLGDVVGAEKIKLWHKNENVAQFWQELMNVLF